MKHLIPYFVQTQFKRGVIHGKLRAFTMFIDLSGFTPMTETLMKQGTEGAEQLSVSLNNIFAPMVSLVYRKGGFIPYFAGDAFTAIFPADTVDPPDPEVLLDTAILLRDLFTREGLKKTAFGDFQIGIKIGMSYGEVEWGIIGDKSLSFYFRGEAIDGCAASEHQASGQDIILDRKVLDRFIKTPPAVIELEDAFFKLIDTERSVTPPPPIQLPELDEAIARRFLPSQILDFNETGEFRNVISIFISFSGIKDHQLFNQFTSIVLDQIESFSGYFKEVDFGDKGGVIVCFFGAPISFENNRARALEFASLLLEELAEMQEISPLQVRIGLTSGLAYTGIVGGKERCQYAVVGNRVNLAARLMINADWGEVLVDEEVQKSPEFTFDHKGDIRYKGIEGNIPTYRLTGRNSEKVGFIGQLIGRDDELTKMHGFASLIFEQQFAGMIQIYGEAGVGKSRLTFELRKRLKEKGKMNWYICQADQILRKPFNPFVFFLRDYFMQSPEATIQENLDHFERYFKKLLKKCKEVESPISELMYRELVRTKSILAYLVGIHYEDSLWDQLDARGRYQNTLSALTNMFKTLSLIRPTVIELEDAHWYDENSIEFIREFMRDLHQFPVLLLCCARYSDDGSKVPLIPENLLTKYQVPVLEIDLNVLHDELLRRFAEVRLQNEIDDEFYELLQRTTNGNPFYLEQILEYFTESKLLIKKDGRWNIKDKSIKISSSINSVLMARIDRLSNLVKETVKTAAVIGREFEVSVLSEVLKEHEEFVRKNGNTQSLLKEQIQTAEQGQIWRAMNELRYIFKHSLLREAVYDMQLGTRLRHLHQLIGSAIERLYSDSIEERYVDLAFHFEQAEVTDKTILYLEKAADYARQNYQNQQAIDYYDLLLKYLKEEGKQAEQITTYLKKGSVLELIGRWEECQEAYTQALTLSNQLGTDQQLLGRSYDSLGNLLMLKGDYEQAGNYLKQAATYFKAHEDKWGISKVYGHLGNWNFRQGKYDAAKDYFIESIQMFDQLPHRSANAQIVANLGLTHMNQGNYDEGIKVLLNEVKICEQHNDKQGLATLNVNLGIIHFDRGSYDEALKFHETGLALSEELGNMLLTCIAIGCIGSVYQAKGNYEKAMDLFIRDLQITEDLGDKQGTAIALGLMGELRLAEGEFEVAEDYLQHNLKLCEELGYRKGIAKTLNALADIRGYRNKLEEAISYYDRAIDISRRINYRLVLGSSLVEKGEILIRKGDFKEAYEIHLEAVEIAETLGNPNLIFEAAIFSARVNYFAGNKEIAFKTLADVETKTRTKHEQAAVHFEYFQLRHPDRNAHQKKALELYQNIVQSEPHYEYKSRIHLLEEKISQSS